MANNTFPVNWKPRPYQIPFLQAMTGYHNVPNSGKKRAVLVWGRQLGKDTTCAIFMFKEALKKPGQYFYVFGTSTAARRAFWEKVDENGLRLIDQIPGMDRVGEPGSMVTRVLVQEMMIELSNRSVIRIIGLDTNPDAARGISPTMVVFSEAAFIDPTVFANIEPAIIMNNATVIYNSTPNGMNHFHKMYQHSLADQEWFSSYHQVLYEKEPGYVPVEGLNEKYFTNLQDSGIMSAEDIAREFGCRWDVQLQGSYYSEQLTKARAEGRVGFFPYDPRYPVNTYWDLGFVDDAVCWFAQNIRGKTVFIDYWEATGATLTDMAHMLGDKPYRYSSHVLPHDGSAKSQQTGLSSADTLADSLADLQVSGTVETMPRLTKQAGIDAVRRRFVDYCFNYELCLVGLDKLEKFHRKYDKRTARFLDEAVHDANSHCADAIRMEAISQSLVGDPFWDVNDIKNPKRSLGVDDDER